MLTSPDVVVHDDDVVEESGEGGDVGDGRSVRADESVVRNARRKSLHADGESFFEHREEGEEVGGVADRVVARRSSRSRVFPTRKAKSQSQKDGQRKTKRTNRDQLRRPCA